MNDLKPCPFCGGINIIHSGFRMYCHTCGAEGPDADNMDESAATEAWNTRAALAQPADVEPVGWRYQHDETGRHMCHSNDGVNTPEDFMKINPRWKLIGPMYAAPQPAHPPAQVPLTEGELLSMWSGGDERFMRPVLGKNKILAFALAVIAAYEAKNGGGK